MASIIRRTSYICASGSDGRSGNSSILTQYEDCLYCALLARRRSIRRQLAAMARSRSERRERRDRSAYVVGPGKERHLETRDAWDERLDANHLGGSDLRRNRQRRQHRVVVRRPGERTTGLEETAFHEQLQSP